ncbi:c-type heme family protein [Lignipirellula cremea]|uniref:Tll0287-like domain-containing protein n=1 Tax=Lignipirellula cremea TaxID=2528010 RepID=A0A518DNV2_9BACT|nr:DUF3365 domain-containing protein [Lignipirellula cremea]QDU93515.1 hypothetical protein Pla8534_12950 [Lignipirellula cremea]
MKKKTLVVLGLLAAIAVGVVGLRSVVTGAEPTPPQPSQAAVARTQKMVQTLDSIYKNAVVLITDKYVHDEDDFAAGSAAVLLFENISKGGSHQVRLIDATGMPYDEKNVARDDFEKEGIKRLKAGAALYEQVVYRDGKPQLRALTAVPVVMQKCVMCHEHYADVKKGDPIGAISYTVPIE